MLSSGVSNRQSEYRYQTKYQPNPCENTETEPNQEHDGNTNFLPN